MSLDFSKYEDWVDLNLKNDIIKQETEFQNLLGVFITSYYDRI